MNGTRLNDSVISTDNRKPSNEFPLRHGDVVVLAEDIKIEVCLLDPICIPIISNKQPSLLRAAPRRGLVRATVAKSGEMTSRDGSTTARKVLSTTQQEEYYSEAIQAEFAVLTQVRACSRDYWLMAATGRVGPSTERKSIRGRRFLESSLRELP